ncbi:ABC-three component system protein, partial [Aeromonas jandaei]
NNEIHDNKVDGDLIIGSTVIKFPSFNIGANGEALRNLIEQHIRLQEDDPIYCMVLDELQSRIKDSPSRNVIGLSEKLRIAGRENYIDEALVSSQKASRLIARLQHVRSYQIFFNHILGLIVTRFKTYVLPLIKSGANELVIRTAINSTIIEPLYAEVMTAGGSISSDAIEGMLYFLTEKCHVEWK